MTQTEEKPDKETLDKWLLDPANYKRRFLGMPAYYNKEDKRLLPPSKLRAFGLRSDIPLFGVTNWTINFANPYSILAGIGIMVALVILIPAIAIFLVNLTSK